jgi:phage host-nuclease inhibitor protein Gam
MKVAIRGSATGRMKVAIRGVRCVLMLLEVASLSRFLRACSKIVEPRFGDAYWDDLQNRLG